MNSPYKKRQVTDFVEITSPPLKFQPFETFPFEFVDAQNLECRQVFEVIDGWWFGLDSDLTVNIFSEKPMYLSASGKHVPKKSSVVAFCLGKLSFPHPPRMLKVGKHVLTFSMKDLYGEMFAGMGVDQEIWVNVTEYWIKHIHEYLKQLMPEKRFVVVKHKGKYSHLFKREV